MTLDGLSANLPYRISKSSSSSDLNIGNGQSGDQYGAWQWPAGISKTLDSGHVRMRNERKR